ncbi:MAG: hemerythrin family protein [Acidobacteria bacterium]|nr:hemerythrin family protein [Acidobacteriota bacterium]
MYTIEWESRLSVGIDKIDAQHRQWIEYFNRASRAVAAQQSREQVSKTLEFLLDYTEMHFSTEEKFMQDSRYPGYAEHRKKHDALRATLKNLVADYQDEGATQDLSEAIETLIGNWLVRHICDVDQKFGAYLAGNKAALSQ